VLGSLWRRKAVTIALHHHSAIERRCGLPPPLRVARLQHPGHQIEIQEIATQLAGHTVVLASCCLKLHARTLDVHHCMCADPQTKSGLIMHVLSAHSQLPLLNPLQGCPVNCGVGSWGGWDSCSAACGGGRQSRSRSVTTQPSNGGAGCPHLSESRDCNTQVIIMLHHYEYPKS
jgi:hypothetical protein